MIPSFPLFERFGVELEYMIVDADTLNVRPEADQLIAAELGQIAEDVPRGKLGWSNELALHVIELKTDRPVKRLAGLARGFQAEVDHVNELLRRSNAMLLPTAMHPWMNPHRQGKLWPHGNRDIYRAFDRIFDCRGHGWTNLQSVHLNLPFADDAEFDRLHTAIRLLLPLLPVLAASSPFIDGQRAPMLDMRLEVYRHNCDRVPSVTDGVIPQAVRSRREYEREILQRIYRDLDAYDPDQILREEWANARGAIARFHRNTIEIRVLDIQECPAADLAILECIVATLKALTDGKWSDTNQQRRLRTEDLKALFSKTVEHGRDAVIQSPAFLKAFGMPAKPVNAETLWRHVLREVAPARCDWAPVVGFILDHGSLAERLVAAVEGRVTRPRLKAVYREVAACLAEGQLFHA